MTDLVSMAQAMSWMGQSGLDLQNTDEDLFQSAIDAASQAVIDILQWDPTWQTVTENYSGLDCPEIFVNRRPISGVTSITIQPPSLGATVLCPPLVVDLTQVIFGDNWFLWQNGRFPRGRKNITIAYSGGYSMPGDGSPEGNPTLPSSITQATLYTLKAMWAAQDVDHNATGESYAGVLSQQFWQSGPGTVPPQAMSLLNRYILRMVMA